MVSADGRVFLKLLSQWPKFPGAAPSWEHRPGDLTSPLYGHRLQTMLSPVCQGLEDTVEHRA